MHGLLDSVPDTEVVGEATSGEEAVSQAATLQPDVILMDIKMPGINGIAATREILAASPHIGILMVTMLEDDELVFAAMRAGARGYVLKGANQADILLAIRAVARGEVIFGPGIARRLLGFFCHHPAAGSPTRLPGTLRAGDRTPGADGAGQEQPGDRGSIGPDAENGAQPCLQHLQ